jgi:hypothetical protein
MHVPLCCNCCCRLLLLYTILLVAASCHGQAAPYSSSSSIACKVLHFIVVAGWLQLLPVLLLDLLVHLQLLLAVCISSRLLLPAVRCVLLCLASALLSGVPGSSSQQLPRRSAGARVAAQ